MNKLFVFLLACLFATSINEAQELDRTWKLQSIDSDNQTPLPVTKNDSLVLNNSTFLYNLSSKDSLQASGDYIVQNNLLVFYYNQPTDTIRRYRITSLTDSTLAFQEQGIAYKFFDQKYLQNKALIAKLQEEKSIIKSEGFSINSLMRGALGMLVLLLIAFLLSQNRKAIRWKTVGLGLLAQLLLAIGVLKVAFIQSIFEFVGKGFVAILDYTIAGSTFLLGDLMNVESYGFIFLFQVLPTIIFFSALTSVLFYLGIIQKIVRGLAIALTKLLGISGAESLSVAGNIFLGQTEAPLMIKAYLEKMTKSEILLVMIGGMATVAGGVLAAYIGFLGGEDEALKLFYAKHLLTASVMAAPGAIVISKILYPQQAKINTEVAITQDKIGSNILDAIANGTTEGLKLAANVGAMLLVFLAFIAMINGILGFVASFDGITIAALNIDWRFTSLNEIIAASTQYDGLSLEFVLGYVFAPLMWLIGVAKEDMALMGQLLGIKLVASEFVGYIQLAELKNIANLTHLKFEKSIIMATYMLCGFANFASIGIQIGGIGSLAPGQRKTLSEFGIKALIGGTIASLLSATIAGMIIG
ncbi:nucleoside transporter C-terminal domain-containing protein [Paucihalobacter sp.]|uniref:nucleoside transporter C-terminal domain-containing protein n=1 Tax=Paucihalobacter sp. TaxID=2850405 RepID=UPI002FDF17DA